MPQSEEPLLARRPSSDASTERGLAEEDALLSGQHKQGPTLASRWKTWRELGLAVYALAATIIVIILAMVLATIPQGEEHKPTLPTGTKRNLIFMVSDGMGPTSLSLTRSYRQHVGGLEWDNTLDIDKYIVGQSRTRSTSSLVTDSAAGATAFSCGKKSYNGAISVLPDHTPCGSVMEAAKKAGYMTGLVVTTRITDATPACFASHVNMRSEEDSIAEQLLGDYPLGRTVDLMLGAGRCHFLANGTAGSCRADDKDLTARAKNVGFHYIDDRAGFDALNGGKDAPLPLLGLFADEDIPYEVDRRYENDVYPSLDEMAQTAIQALTDATKHSSKGFFLMIEGSRIDHAGHGNDPVAQVHEVLAYDAAWSSVISFLSSSADPGVAISTSDHETGGLATAKQVHAYEYPQYLWHPSVLANASHSVEWLMRDYARHLAGADGAASRADTRKYLQRALGEHLGIHDASAAELDLLLDRADYAVWTFADILSRRAQTGWSTHGHSAADVNIYASDRDEARALAGSRENTEVGKFLRDYLGVEQEVLDVTRELRGEGKEGTPWINLGWMGKVPDEGERLDGQDHRDHYTGDFKKHKRCEDDSVKSQGASRSDVSIVSASVRSLLFLGRDNLFFEAPRVGFYALHSALQVVDVLGQQGVGHAILVEDVVIYVGCGRLLRTSSVEISRAHRLVCDEASTDEESLTRHGKHRQASSQAQEEHPCGGRWSGMSAQPGKWEARWCDQRVLGMRGYSCADSGRGNGEEDKEEDEVRACSGQAADARHGKWSAARSARAPPTDPENTSSPVHHPTRAAIAPPPTAMPLNILRLNQRSLHPNERVVFIKALPGPGSDTGEDFLKRLAAQCFPIMRDHHLSVTTLEEYEPNREFLGRNFNAGEVIQLVLKSHSGRWLPFRHVQMVMMHELAHCMHMNHSRAFWAVRNVYTTEMKELWGKGYTGEGMWGRGRSLYDGQIDDNTALQSGDVPEHLCGGTYRTRWRKRKMKPELSYHEKKERRILKKFGTGGEKLGEDAVQRRGLESKRWNPTQPRVAKSKRGRELRAAALLDRSEKAKSDLQSDQTEAPGEQDVEETESEYEDDPGEDGREALDHGGTRMIKVCEEDDMHGDHNAMQELAELKSLPTQPSRPPVEQQSISYLREDADIEAEEDVSTESEKSFQISRSTNELQPRDLTPQETFIEPHTLNGLASGSKKATLNPESAPGSRIPPFSTANSSSPPAFLIDAEQICNICSLSNTADAMICGACANVLDTDRLTRHWRCQSDACQGGEYINADDVGRCGICGAAKP
ncbi:hypothetical protein FH972_022715 [Carpinus fangiana]|uniref:Alkaline phosphatase n=1 Tax=Carpinus fangiana TaxID=176857 RepID=A0A5N6KTD1_9ROSI|nr:hypothetical protein FH972_022715 [Carpinus fangiana]